MLQFRCYCVIVFLLFFGCKATEPELEVCEDDPRQHLLNTYEKIPMYRYSWNMGEGVRLDTTVEATIFFSEVGSEHLRVAFENVDIIVYLNKITETGHHFSRDFLSPHNHAYLNFRCSGDTARLDFRFGALGFDDWYRADFRYR